VLIQLPTGWPLPLIGALYLTNCSEAVIAAGGLYLLSDAPWRFDTVRRLMAFFAAAVIVAPVLSSFADAAAVAWFAASRTGRSGGRERSATSSPS
jgi:integral membrane sensor domain MASE1